MDTRTDDVVTAAFAASGRPALALVDSDAATCARCGTPGTIATPVKHAVSRTFTGFDAWADPQGKALCPVCTWLYRDVSLRAAIHLITRRPHLENLTPTALYVLLSAPLPADHAVVVPLRPGRKHLLPHARWGTVCIDDITVRWRTADTVALGGMHRLRGRGFSVRALQAHHPRHDDLKHIARPQWADVFADWAVLDDWRTNRPRWEIGIRATSAAASLDAADAR